MYQETSTLLHFYFPESGYLKNIRQVQYIVCSIASRHLGIGVVYSTMSTPQLKDGKVYVSYRDESGSTEGQEEGTTTLTPLQYEVLDTHASLKTLPVKENDDLRLRKRSFSDSSDEMGFSRNVSRIQTSA